MIRIVRIQEVMSATGLSRSTIWRRVRNHEFPTPLKLGGLNSRSVGWREQDVDAWLEGLDEIDN